METYRGRFDHGWEAVREESFARQKALGVIPQDAELTPMPESPPAWVSLSPPQKQLAARLMEAYAATPRTASTASCSSPRRSGR